MLATECEPGDMVFASSAIWLRRRWLRVTVLPPYCWSAVMLPASNPDLHPLIRKLESIAPVSDDERRAITALPITVRELKADADIVRDQDRPSQCCAILEGFACRYKLLPGGRRQIMSFHIPGDIPDLQSLHLDVMDHSLATVVPTKVAFIPHEAVRTFLRAHPRIADVFWRETLIDAAVFRGGSSMSAGAMLTPGSHTSCAKFMCASGP